MLELEKYILPVMRLVWERQKRYDAWLEVEIDIVEAYEELGLIPKGIAAQMRRAASFTIEAIDREDAEKDQEMVSFSAVIKGTLARLAPETLPFWHKGVTSFDIWEPARAMQIRDSLSLIKLAAKDLIYTLREICSGHKYDLQIGRTHGVHAEPITFGLKIAVWLDEMERWLADLERRETELVVGKISGATGNYANIDPRIEEIVCKKLGIASAKISNQIVSRDHHFNLIAILSSGANSMEKFATNIRLLQRTETGEVEEPFYKGGGSSAMPHKRNPNKSERVCSLARVVRGFLVPAGENQALQWDERSIDESAAERFIIPLSLAIVHYNLCLMNEIMSGLNVNTQRMLENIALTKGVIFSENVMLALTEKGMAREDARLAVQKLAQEAWNNRDDFPVKVREEWGETLLSDQEINACFLPEHYLKNVDQIFARFGL